MYKGTLIAFGCSNTAGTETILDFGEGDQDHIENYNHAYPKFLAEKLNYEYRNYACSGISNQQIASCVFNYVSSDEFKTLLNPLITVGWTNDKRIDVLLDNNPSGNDDYYSKFEHPFFSASKKVKRITLSNGHFKACLNFLLKSRAYFNNESFSDPSYNFLGSINPLLPEFIVEIFQRILYSSSYCELNFFAKYAVAMLLQEKQLPYITFPTCNYNVTNKYKLLSTNNNIIEPLLFWEFKKYGKAKGGHLKESAHIKFADYLYEELLTRKII